MIGECKQCGYQAGIFGLSDGLCKSCLSSNTNILDRNRKSNFRVPLFSTKNNIGFLLGVFFAIFSTFSFIAIFVYLIKKKKQKATQAFFLPLLSYTLFYIMYALDENYRWVPNIGVAVFFLVSIPIVSYLVVINLTQPE